MVSKKLKNFFIHHLACQIPPVPSLLKDLRMRKLKLAATVDVGGYEVALS